MRITSIFLFTIIIFGGLSCSNDDSLIHNKTKGILEKYPEPTVTITAHNHIPFLAKNILEEKAITKSVNIISDIAWANGFGRTITARSDEMVIPDNMNRYIYPGSILEASSIAETRFTPIPVKNNPVHVSVSFPAKKVGGTIKEPSLLNIRQFVMDLMQQNNIGKQSATLSFDVQKFVSYDELKMTFGSNESKYSINSLVYWVTYVHNVVYSFYRSMIYCYINSTQRCAGSIVIDIIPTNGADKRKFFPFAPYFPVTNVIKRYFYPYFPAIIGIKGYSFPYFPYLSGIMKIKTALYSLFSRLDWHKTVVFPCLGEIYEGIRSLSWEIPVT